MRKRSKMSSKNSKKKFRKGQRINSKNANVRPKRGGTRL